MQQRISIVVPVYNVESYLCQCVNSILNQTHRNIELILVDDGSTDASGVLCDQFAQLDSRVKVIHQNNLGVSFARNKGIQACNGDYMIFIDSDDWVEANMLEIMLKAILKNNSDACFCDRYYKNEGNLKIALSADFPSQVDTDECIRRHLRYGFLASTCLGLINQTKTKNCLFDTDLHTLEDWEYNFRMLTCIDNLVIIREAFYHYRTVEGSASKSSLDEKKLSCLLIPEKISNYIEKEKLPYSEEVKYIPIFLLNHLLVILANSEYRAKECAILKKKAQEILKYTCRSSFVPRRQKIYTVMCAISPRIFCCAYHLKYGGHYHE